MKTILPPSRRFEFCYPQLDTLMEVEETGHDVVIRVTRDVFSDEQKLAMVRHLAREGFISEEHLWCPALGRSRHVSVRWLVDVTWLVANPAARVASRRFMTRLFFGAGGLWLLLIWAFFIRAGR
ncbi:MAG TPA: hypothetical protein VHD62_19550 [Opitutaceae bacterium]|nr:hypothetical protein [Opitutaceae bacterium]